MNKKDNPLTSYLEAISDDKMMLSELGQLMTNRLASICVAFEILEHEFLSVHIEEDLTQDIIKEMKQDFHNSARDMREMINILRNYAQVKSNKLEDKDD